MRYRLLGPSGLRVSELCLGTMSFGDAWGFGADEQVSAQILQAYAEAGGNFIDTADVYSRGYVGGDVSRWLHARPGMRDFTCRDVRCVRGYRVPADRGCASGWW